MNAGDSLAVDQDGFYHPSTEDEICDLVRRAREEGLQVRCRGAAHSLGRVIYTDPGTGESPVPNKVSHQFPPKGPNINISLDRYTGVEWIDEANGVVEVYAGTHLGKDPEDESGAVTLENGLLYQIFQKGWALSDLGGITHQTVSGFLSTGSAGGSLTYDLGENLLAFRVVDGNGTPRWIDRDEDADLFHAFGVSMGLLGIISKVRLQLVPMYNIWGQEIVTPTDLGKGCPIDLFGAKASDKPSLEEFLSATPYTRILWWPQPELDRIAIWQAARGRSLPVFDPHPYEQFSGAQFFTQLQQLGGAILFNLVGNRRFRTVWRNLQNDLTRFHVRVRAAWEKRVGRFWAEVFFWILTILFWPDIFVLTWFFSVCRPCLRWLYPKVVRFLQPFTRKGKSPTFVDYYWRSLPMDNAADDVSLGTEFTEIFIPVRYTERVMQLLKAHFEENGYAATGYYCVEIYAGYRSEFWMSPSYHEHTLRIDIFWYIDNEGDPAAADGFFRQFWDLLVDNDIPFRLHWGKYLPEYDFSEWTRYFRDKFPRWDDFLELRRLRDPKDVFLTDYWRRHLLGETD